MHLEQQGGMAKAHARDDRMSLGNRFGGCTVSCVRLAPARLLSGQDLAREAHMAMPSQRVHRGGRRRRFLAGRLPDRRPGGKLARVSAYGNPLVAESSLPQSTATMLARVRAGETAAREQLCRQYLPILMRWAHGRLPTAARDLAETADLVQITLLKALGQIDHFQPRHEGAFLAYLRTGLLNVLRNEIDRSLRRGGRVAVEAADLAEDAGPTPAVDADLLLDYERALTDLTPEWREAILLRLEFGFGYEEIAAAMERPSANAARMLVHRAMEALSQRMAAT